MSHRILVVDDNEDVAHITASFLTAKGYTVVTAHDGKRALELIAESPPHCVLLDVMMPNMSGHRGPELSEGEPGHLVDPGDPRDREEPRRGRPLRLQDGADYYITKPFSAQQLLYGVRLVLGLGSPAPARTVDPTSTSHH